MSKPCERFEVSPDVGLYTSHGGIAEGNLKGIEFYGRTALVEPSRKLTADRVKYLAMAAAGMTYADIGKHTYRAPDTIKSFQSNAYSRLGATNIAHATTLLFQEGILVPFFASIDRHFRVSERETEVLDLMSQGYSKPRTAEKLGTSALTVKSQLTKITSRNEMEGFGTAGLVMTALFDGLIETVPVQSAGSTQFEPVMPYAKLAERSV